MYSRPTVKRTYSSRPRQFPSSPRTSSPAASPSKEGSPAKRKRPLLESQSINQPPPKRVNVFGAFSTRSKEIVKSKPKTAKKTNVKKDIAVAKPLTQLHFVVDTILRECPLCLLSYTKGAIDDELIHKKHCSRVQRGLEWGKEEEREAVKANVLVVDPLVVLRTDKGTITGRIISVPADATGKIGAKLHMLLETINMTLSAPSLTHDALKSSKAYLFLAPSTINSRERIAGCVIAQQITAAMNIISNLESNTELQAIKVDTSLYCDPTPRPTPLGISRLFVSSSYRRQGIATLLLKAAARHFIFGCELDPAKGQVAFSQPTDSGRKVMESWGKGGIRIYQE